MSNKPVLKIFTYSGTGKDEPFPNEENQLIISEYSFNDKRMGSVALSASAYYESCLDDLWQTGKQYADFRGERYFIIKTPSSSKDNTDVRYKHQIEFVPSRNMLNNIYFYDVVTGSSGTDRYVSNSTKVLFYGDVQEFVGRINHSLSYSSSPYSVVVDEGITSEAKQVSIEDMYISNALQEIFNIYELPYYFVGNVIHVGYTDNAITHTFRYGRDYELLSVSKTNANYKLTNRVTGTGSSDNIQFYYPNESNDRKAIEAAGGKWITPAPTLMPPIYRETFGKERFYNAKNDTYISPETGDYYTFENEYTTSNPIEQIVDFSEIKPTIKETKNLAGYRIDEIEDVAFDDDDNDEIDEDTGDYIHSYFYVKLRTFNGNYGFNLFDHGIVGSDATMVMTSGACAPCEFTIGVVEAAENGKQVFKNPVQVDKKGNIVPGNYEDKVNINNLQPEQQDTSTNSVWIALKKDNTTFGVVMPNSGGHLFPKRGDSFVITNIDMPKSYISKAENELKEAIIKYMAENNREKFTFNIKLSRIFLAENPSVEELINSNARIDLEYNGKYHQLYISSYTYKADKEIIPEITIELADTLSINKNAIDNAVDSVKQDIMNSIGSSDFFKQGLKYFIRKDTEDYARFFIDFLRGIKIGNYIPGADFGGIFAVDEQGHTFIETDMLKVRMKATFETLEILNTNSIGGRQIITPAGSIKCIKVVDREDILDEEGNKTGEKVFPYYRCYFLAEQDGVKVENRFKVKDQAISQDFNIMEGVYENVSNHYYWRLVVGKGDNYIDLSKTDADTGSGVPRAGDVICQLGNREDISRQNALIFSSVDTFSPSMTLYAGINSYSYTNKDYISYGVDKTTNKAFYRVYGDMYVGQRDLSQYVKYENGKVSIKGKLEVGTTIGDNSTIEEALAKAKNDAITEATRELTEYAAQVTEDLKSLQDQVDGAVYSFFESYDPSLSNLPASEWKTEAEKNSHANDTFTNITTGNSWKWVKNGDKWEWAVITDTATLKALELAAKAQDTADGKRRVFVSQPTKEQAYDIGDLWVNATYGTTYNNDFLRCKTAKAAGILFNINHWELASKYTDDTVANQAKEVADAAKKRLDEWAKDGVISPTEKQAIKDEIARIDADKKQITDGYTLYGIGTPTTYNTAYTKYRAQLVTLSAATPENIPIPADFATNQTNYYNQRTAAFSAIDSASKAAVDKAQKDIGDVKSDIGDVKTEISGLKDFTDDAFADGIIDRSEYTTIVGYKKNIVTFQKDVSESYSKVYNNALLEGTVKTNLKTANDGFNKAVNELITAIDSIINRGDNKVTSEDRALVNGKYDAFNIKYGDYVSALTLANKYIQDKINGKAENALSQLLEFKPVKDAFLEKTLIDGGVILSSFMALGYTDKTTGEYKTMSGINGVYDSTAEGNGLAAWFGGSMIDLFDYYDPETKKFPNAPANAAKGADRMDGTGYRANGNLWWDKNGTVHADAKSFFIGEESVGNLLSAFQIVMRGNDIDYIIPQAPFQNLIIANTLKIGKAVLKWDEANNALYVEKNDGSKVGFYATDYLSAMGANPGGGGGGGVSGNRLDEWSEYTTEKATWLLSAKLGDDLNTRVNSLEAGSAVDFVQAGSGIVVKSVVKDGSTVTVTKGGVSFGELGSRPTTLSGYGITDAKIASGVITLGSTTITPLTAASSLAWSKLTGKPTTIAGYGITDAKIANGIITLGSATITPLTSASALAWAKLTGKPTTIAGYGITDAYTKTETDSKYVTALGTSGNYLTWTKNGTASNITVPFATSATNATRLTFSQLTNQDLNAYTYGAYSGRLFYGAGSNSVINNVVTGQAFGLMVWRIASGWTGHLLMSPEGVLYTRRQESTNSSWSAWDKVIQHSMFVSYLGETATTAYPGNKGKANASAIAALKAITITAGNGLTGGGNLTANRTISLKPATTTTLGGVIVGDRLSVDSTGKITATYTYTLPTASATVLGGVKVGTTLDIASGVLNLKSGVSTAGTYFKTTVDTYGRVTAGSNPTTLSGFGITDGVNAVTVAGSGNVISAASVSGHSLTLTKGITALTTVTVAGSGNAVTTATVSGATVTLTKGNTFLTKAAFDELFEKVNIGTSSAPIWTIKAKMGLWTDDFLSAMGANPGGGGGGGVSGNRLDEWSEYTTEKATWLLSAKLGIDLNTRVGALEAGSAVNFIQSGSGIVVRSVVKSGTDVTVTKGNVAFSELTNKPTTIAGYGITDAPTKTGGGASGTWGISVSGSAAIGNILYTGSLANANTVSGRAGSKYYNVSTSATGHNFPTGYGALLRLQRGEESLVTNSQTIFDLFIGNNNGSNIYVRNSTGNGTDIVWTDFQRLITTSNYTSLINKIGTATVGSSTLPIYLNAGTPTACSTTLGVSITGSAATLGGYAHTAFLKTTGGALTGNVAFSTDSSLMWSRNTDFASIRFANTADNDTDSYMEFMVGDNGNEYFNFVSKNGSTRTSWMSILGDGVHAPTFIGKLKGNADTATVSTKLGTATVGSSTRPIYLNAGVPTQTGTSLAVDVTGGAAKLNSNSAMTYGWNGMQYFNISGTAGNAVKVNDTPSTAWWHIMRFNHANSAGFYTDMAIPFNDNSIYYKRVANGVLANNGWVRLLDALNYTAYTVTKTGLGASGTWGISINGTAPSLRSKGDIAPQTGRTQTLGDVYSYTTRSGASAAGAPTTYTAVIGFGNGVKGTVEIAGGWTSGMGLWYRSLRDTEDNWYAWRAVIDSVNYKTLITQLGTTTIGGTAKPIYLNAGVPTAITASVGASTKGVYLNAGTITAMSSTVGSPTLPVYMNAGTITQCSTTLGVSITGTAAVATKLGTATVGGSAKPIYLNGGTATALSSTIGDSSKPVYLNAGTITATTWGFAGTAGLVVRKSGYMVCNTAGLSSYWGKMATLKWTASNDDRDITLYVHSAYNSFYGIILIRARWSSATSITASLKMLVGNIPSDRLRLYYDKSAVTGAVELWGDVRGQYGVFNTYVLSETSRSSLEYNQVTVLNNNFSTVQTLPTWEYLSLGYLPIHNNAASATKLATARTLWGRSFDGTANVTGALSSVGNITNLGHNTYDIGTATSNFRRIWAVTTNMRHIDAPSSALWSDSALYIGYGASTGDGSPTKAIYFFYSSATDDASRKHIATINNDGLRMESSKPINMNGGLILNAPVVKSNGILTLTSIGTNGVYIKCGDDNTRSVVMGNGFFKPFDTANNKISLGSSAARWSTLYAVNANLTGVVAISGNTSIGGTLRIGSYILTSKADGLSLTKVDGTSAGFYSSGFISAMGANPDSGGGGGTSGNRLDDWTSYDAAKATWLLSAKLGNDLNTRVKSLEGGSALTFSTTGSGNAVTAISKTGTTVTVTKGNTFVDIASAQTISGIKTFSNAIVTTNSRITSGLKTETYIQGNQGSAIINSTATAGYTMLAKMNSTNGVFTHGVHNAEYKLQYTAKSTITAGTNTVTKTVILLNESGGSSFPGNVTAPTFIGALNGTATNANQLGTIAANGYMRTDGTNNLVVLTGGGSAGNVRGWRLVSEATLGDWSINSLVLATTSRHSGQGILVVSIQMNENPSYNAYMRFNGNVTGWSNDGTWKAFYNTTTKKFRLFWYNVDFNSTNINVLSRQGVIPVPKNGTWYTSLPDDNGDEITYRADYVGSAGYLWTARTINGTAFNGSANITTAVWGNARTISLGQDSTGSVSVNGSANVTLNARNRYVVGDKERQVAISAESVSPPYSDETGFSQWAFGTARNTARGYLSIMKPSAISLGVQAHGTIIAAGTGDTHCFIGFNYGDAQVIVGGGNANKVVWKQTLAFRDGTILKATNLAGGAAGSIPYQSATGATAYLAASGTNGYVLKFNTSTKAPYWSADINNYVLQSQATADVNRPIIIGYSSSASGDINATVTNQVYLNSKFYANPGTGVLAAPTFAGTLSGNATTATTLKNARTINGTNFNGSANIVTSYWGTARNITVGSQTLSINGSANYNFTRNEMQTAYGREVAYVGTPSENMWYRIAVSAKDISNWSGLFYISTASNGYNNNFILYASICYGTSAGAMLNQIGGSYYSNAPQIKSARLVYHTTWSDNYAYLEVLFNKAISTTVRVRSTIGDSVTLYPTLTAGSIPSGYTTKAISLVNGGTSTTGETVTNSANGFRIVYGNYGVFFRSDGSSAYLLATNSGDLYGEYSSLRPFYFSLSTGKVYMKHGVDIVGNLWMNNNAIMNVSYIKGNGTLHLMGNSDITLRRGDADTKSLILNETSFKPYDVANGQLLLGNTSARWKNIYSVNGDFSSTVKSTYTQGFNVTTATNVYAYMRYMSGTVGWDLAVKDTEGSGCFQIRRTQGDGAGRYFYFNNTNFWSNSNGGVASGHTNYRWSNVYSVAGSYTGTVTAKNFVSTVATGTAPLTVTSTTQVNNLNADLLDGTHKSGLFTAFTYTSAAVNAAPTLSTISSTIGGVAKSISIPAQDGIRRTSVGSSTAGLSSYWVKVADVTLGMSYGDAAMIMAVNSLYSNGGQAPTFVKVAARTNGSNTAAPSADLVIYGGLQPNSFRVYHSGPGANTTFELWMNVYGQYAHYNFTVISEGNRGARGNYQWKLYNTSFTTVQTPTLANKIDGTWKGMFYCGNVNCMTISCTKIDAIGIISVTDTTDSSSTTTGSINTDGGVGIAKQLRVGGASTFTGKTTHNGGLSATAGGFSSTLTVAGTSVFTGKTTHNGGIGATTGTFSSAVTATDFKVGSTSYGNGRIELYHANPYIDFHFGNSTADYTTRLYESTSGRLRITGQLQLDGHAYFGGTTYYFANNGNIKAAAIAGTTGTFSSTLAVTGAGTFSSTLNVGGVINANNTTDSTAATNGSLVCDGGVGIAKQLRVNGIVSFASGLNVSGVVNANNTTDATSTTAASLVCDGGVGIVKQLRVGGATTLSSTLSVTSTATIAGVLNNSNTTDATSTTAAAMKTAGGLGVVKQLRVGGAATLSSTLSVTSTVTAAGVISNTNTTDASSTTAAAMKTAGGLGVAKQLRVGGASTFSGNVYIGKADDVTDAGANGALVVTGSINAQKRMYAKVGIFTDGYMTAMSSASDIRLKTDLTEYSALSYIRNTKSVKYHWNEIAKKRSHIFNTDEWAFGLIAQDLQEKGLSQLVSDVFKDYLVVDYERAVPICWRAIQEVDDEQTKLKKRVAELEQEVKELKRKKTLMQRCKSKLFAIFARK